MLFRFPKAPHTMYMPAQSHAYFARRNAILFTVYSIRYPEDASHSLRRGAPNTKDPYSHGINDVLKTGLFTNTMFFLKNTEVR